MPPVKVPQEDLVADEIVEYLKPFSEPAGPLKVRKVTYVDGRFDIV